MTWRPPDEDDEPVDRDSADRDPVDSDIDPEGPDPHEMDYSDEPDLEVCPHCRRMISEDADRCSHCGQFILPQDAPLSRTSWIVIAVIALLLIAFLVTMLPL